MENLIFVLIALGVGGVAGFMYAKQKYGISKKAD
jgi:hypothetical protein